MFCSISGQVPEEPVVSLKSGMLFERRLIEKALNANGSRDPITNEPLTKEDLVSVKSSATGVVKPRPVQATTIPGMLALFQSEWDTLVLEAFTVKQQLETVRQELANSLYQQDGAARVIARLIKERDEARTALSQLQGNPGAHTSNGDSMDVEGTTGSSGINAQVIQRITDMAATLSAGRKKRSSPSVASVEQIQAYTMASSTPLHNATPAGVFCLDVLGDNIVTGGNDHQVIVFNKTSGKVAVKLAGHSKKVNDVHFVGSESTIISASADKTAKVWVNGKNAASISHGGDVSAVAAHPSGDYFVSASADSTWAFNDINSGTTRASINAPAALTSARFHPDGVILGTGSVDSIVRIWDVKTQQQVHEFKHAGGSVASLAFSENGYYFLSAADKVVKVWDLRKLSELKSIDFAGAVRSVNFDFSGNYFAVGSDDVRVYQSKSWNELVVLPDHKGAVTGVCFGADAKFLASTSVDRSLKIFTAGA